MHIFANPVTYAKNVNISYTMFGPLPCDRLACSRVQPTSITCLTTSLPFKVDHLGDSWQADFTPTTCLLLLSLLTLRLSRCDLSLGGVLSDLSSLPQFTRIAKPRVIGIYPAAVL